MRSVLNCVVLVFALVMAVSQDALADGAGALRLAADGKAAGAALEVELSSVEEDRLRLPAYGVPAAKRMELLAPRLRSYRNESWFAPAISLATMGWGVGWGTGALAFDNDAFPKWIIGPAAIAVVTGSIALSSSERVGMPVLGVGALTVAGVAGVLAAVDSRDSSPWLAGGVGSLISAGVVATGALIRLPVSRSRVAADYDRIATSELRETVTEGEARAIEQRFKSSEYVLSWHQALIPLDIGMAVTSFMLAEQYNSTASLPFVGLGVLWTVNAMVAPFRRTDFEAYENELDGFQVSVAPTLGGLAMFGTF